MTTLTRIPLLLACSLLLLLAACTSSRQRSDEIAPETAEQRFQSARRALDSGKELAGFESLAELWATANLAPELRLEVDAELGRAVDRLLPTLTRADSDPDDLHDCWNRDLPRRHKVRLAVAEARIRLAQGDRKDAWRLIGKLEGQFPEHEERAAASEVVAAAGLSLARDPGKYLIFFRYRDAAVEVLDYLVLHYPSNKDCPEAYRTLGEIYAEEHEYADAIARLEDLLLYHPDDPRAVEAELRIPELRLEQLERPDFDRGALVLARDESRRWLERHPQHAWGERARKVLAHAEGWLVDSDLITAAFYRRIDQPIGQRQHAERALDLATRMGDEPRIARCRQLLPAAEVVPASAPAGAKAQP